MIGNSHSSIRQDQKGVVLLEALIAILIFSLGILAIVGLQASMIGSASDAQYRSEASYIAQQRIGQMWSNPSNLVTYIETNTDISNLLPGGLRTVTNNPGTPVYVVTVTWQPPGQSQHRFSTTATIVGG